MIVYYFGADAPWEQQKESDLNRRNMAVLLAIAVQPNVELVYNVIRCTRKLLLNKRNQITSSHTKIINLYIGMVLPERGFLKLVSSQLNKFIIRRLNPKAYNREHTVSWCYWPKGYLDYKFLGLNNRMIFDTDHNIIEDPNLALSHKETRAQLLLEVGKEATLILSSSRSMISWYNDKTFKNTKLMMNGVFASRVFKIKANVQSNNPSQITYCGTLSKWIKIDWLIKMAQDQPDWTINVIGKNYKTELSSQLEGINNIKMHGYLQPIEVDAILKKTDVCIGLYREEDALDVNSMKLYDYLAQGLPVVVNKYHPNLEADFDHLITVKDNYLDFITAIKTAQPISNTKLKLFLNNATWQNRIQPIIQTIDA